MIGSSPNNIVFALSIFPINESATSHLNDGYKVIINAPKTTRGLYLGDYSEIPSEKEVLIQKGTKYKVVKTDVEKGEIEIELYD